MAGEGRLTTDSFPQIRHLDRCQRRLKTLVAALQACAIDRLLQSVAGEHAECVGNSGFLRRLSDPPRDFVGDDVIVQGVATEKTADADDRVIFPGFGEAAGSGWNFESAGDAGQIYFRLLCSQSQKAIGSALQQAFCYEFIESGDDDCKSPACGAQCAFYRRYGCFRNLFNLDLCFAILGRN